MSERQVFWLVLVLWLLAMVAVVRSAAADEPVRMVRDCYSIGVPNEPATLRVNGADVCTTPICRVCTPAIGVYVLDFELAGQTSLPLTIERVADMDADGDRLIGFTDFGAFSQRFGQCSAPNGRVIACP